jgi:Uma2 family endonuclease
MAIRSTATVDDVLRLGARGERFELIDGDLVQMSPTGFEHGDIETHVAWVFYSFVLPRRLGKVCSGEVLFRLDPESRLARAPDVAFVRQERLRGQDLTGAFTGAPDIAIEIVSPSDSAKDIQRKVEDWLAHGTLVVLVMYPETRSLVIWRPGRALSRRHEDVVDLDDVLPGFHRTIPELFPPPEGDLPESNGA